MARLRFPGRPGYRFDRLGVRYGADEAKNITDPTLVIVANIHRGLRHFRELFGESDEVISRPYLRYVQNGGHRGIFIDRTPYFDKIRHISSMYIHIL